MKRICVPFVALLICTFFSCKKTSNDPVPTPDPPDNRPLQLVKKITRYEISGQVTVDSVSYSYDTAGHLTLITNLKTKLTDSKYIYADDSLATIIYYGVNNRTDTFRNSIKYFDGGNTMFMDFTRPGNNGGIDTVLITYKWSGTQLREAWTYLNMANPPMNILQKSILTYNSDGNEFENTLIPAIGPSQLQTRGVGYDQKKNFFSTLSRLNYIFMAWGFPAATRSVNNPVKGENGSGQQTEYIWTYNKDDYPLTMQVKGKNYVAVELTYNK
ncbi:MULTISPECIES: hypothetical protein [Niastella]|uniref:DUF4595 domain-containing protein n=1 Tax=Niastella soli TaxID=2821487 RepID=A0ABS3YX17_9BACT|nr:hypothetical protein [Niastella soli]MBO9202474.1 hypothetical protein [Niastella soli]